MTVIREDKMIKTEQRSKSQREIKELQEMKNREERDTFMKQKQIREIDTKKAL